LAGNDEWITWSSLSVHSGILALFTVNRIVVMVHSINCIG
jgi:hypothetical protein